MSTGSFGCWAMKAGDFHAREFDGTSTGLDEAIAYCGSNGVVTVFPGSGEITMPTIPSGVIVIQQNAGVQTVYGAGGAIRPWVNVLDFPTFQAAHDALPAIGGTIFIPRGQYSVLTTPIWSGLHVTKPCTIEGPEVSNSADAGVYLHAWTNVSHPYVWSGDSDQIWVDVGGGVTIRNLYLDGDGMSSGSGCGIRWYHAGSDGAGLRIENVTTYMMPSWGLKCDMDATKYVSNLDVVGCSFGSSVSGGDVLIGSSVNQANNNVQFTRCNFNGPGFSTHGDSLPRGAVHLYHTSVVRFTNCGWQGRNNTPCLSLQSNCDNVILRDAYFERLDTASATVHAINTSGPINMFVLDSCYFYNQSTDSSVRLFKSGASGSLRKSYFGNMHLKSSLASDLQTDDIVLGAASEIPVIVNSHTTSTIDAGTRDVSVSGTGATLLTIASATTMTLPEGGQEAYIVSGTTTITSLTASWPGRRATLIFSSTAQMTDGSNLKLQGNFTGAADRTITLVCNGTNWYEVARRETI